MRHYAGIPCPKRTKNRNLEKKIIDKLFSLSEDVFRLKMENVMLKEELKHLKENKL